MKRKRSKCPRGPILRTEALRAGIQVYPKLHRLPLTHCPGIGTCGTCRVLITKGIENASPMGRWEQTRFKISMAYIGHEGSMRLACQTRVMGDMTVETQPALNLFGDNFFS